MRLAMITQDFPPAGGGIARYAAALAERLGPRTESFVLVAPAHPEADDRAWPFEVIRRGQSDSVGVLAPVASLVTRRGVDTVFAAQWGAAVAAALARRRGGLGRLGIAAHGREILLEPWPFPASALYRRLRDGVLTSADALLPVSSYTSGLLRARGVDEARITVAHNGVDAARFAPVDASSLRRAHGIAERRVLLTVSRLVPRKGIDTVIATLDRLPADVMYLVVGEGPDRPRLEALARPLGERVRFIGPATEGDLAGWYSACDVFVMPARSEPPDVEGFGLVFLEAGAAGKPVIGAAAGGVVDAVVDGETGFLVPPGDVEALARALLTILDDRDLARALGTAGAARAAAASWDQVADRVATALSGP